MKKKLTEQEKRKRAMGKLASYGGKATYEKYGRDHFVALAKKSNAIQKKKKKLAGALKAR